MWSWWGTAAPELHTATSESQQRTLKTRQVQIEVIGGTTSSAQWDSRRALSSRQKAIDERIKGPPRLPSELITHIVLVAASDLTLHGTAVSGELLRLASVDRSCHHAIVTSVILPQLCLNGARQVKAFARDLQRNILNLRAQVKRVKRLAIRRGGDRTTLDFVQIPSLFSGAEELAQFERITMEPLTVILSYCTNIEQLSLDMTARVLQPRPIMKIEDTLKELITLQTVYGGDINESLWSPRISSLPRWSSLTHLQLHGPRFRMTAQTVLAISQLPSLTHLALIMPLLIQPSSSSNTPDRTSTNTFSDNKQAEDALGRYNILQILLERLGPQLQMFLLVCHDVENYVGNVQRLGGWFRSLHWRCGKDTHPGQLKQAARLVLVTAKPQNPNQTSPHPNLYSRWMLQRAVKGNHWSWNSEEDSVGVDVCDDMNLVYAVESWRVPVVVERNESPYHAEDPLDRRQEMMEVGAASSSVDTVYRGEDVNTSDFSESDVEVNGIDNLD